MGGLKGEPREYEALFEVEDRHWWFVALRREIRRALQSHALPTAGGRWLDAGAGPEVFSQTCARSAPEFRVGLDSSLHGILLDEADARVRAFDAAMDDDLATPRALAELFGLITSIDILCHRDVEEAPALSEMHRCLQPGGVLILQVPAFSWLFGAHDSAVWTKRRFRRGEVEKLLEKAGIRVSESFSSG